MSRVIISPVAERDMKSILLRSQEQFGAAARQRYETVLAQAIQDVADDPDRAGSHERPELAPNVRTYHVSHSQHRAAGAAGRVKRPRHFLLYRVDQDGCVQIGRVLHDSMDLGRHLPDEYRRGSR
jgi:toxin ParE1/3/4